MSEGVKSAEEKAAEERRGPAAGAQRQRGPMGMALPGEKSQTFLPSAKRLMRRLRPERAQVAVVVVLAVVSVALTAIGPKILGTATNLIFEGFFGRRLPAGVTKEQVVAGLRAQGDAQQADLVSGMDLVPGQGIDFTAAGPDPPVRPRPVCAGCVAAVALRLDPRRRRHPHHQQAARRRGGQAQRASRCPTSTASRAASCSAA